MHERKLQEMLQLQEMRRLHEMQRLHELRKLEIRQLQGLQRGALHWGAGSGTTS